MKKIPIFVYKLFILILAFGVCFVALSLENPIAQKIVGSVGVVGVLVDLLTWLFNPSESKDISSMDPESRVKIERITYLFVIIFLIAILIASFVFGNRSSEDEKIIPGYNHTITNRYY